MLNKKIYLSILMGMIILATCSIIVNAKDVEVNPTSIDKAYTIGDSQLNDVTLTFENNDNDTFDLSLTKSGTASSLITLSTTTLNFAGESTTTLDISFDIPDTTSPGLYSAYITYDVEKYVPIYIDVKKAVGTEDCRLIIYSSEYIYTISKSTPPYQDSFAFRISSKCTAGVDITEIKQNGAILTDSGYAPLRLDGGLPKGFFDGGEVLSLDAIYDVSNLERGTYVSYIVITGTDRLSDETITSSMKFKITVVGTAGPVGDVDYIDPPKWEPIPQELVTNNSYTIVARDVNPNLEIVVEPNPYIYGEMVEVQGNDWLYTFRPVKIGNTVLKFYATYKGGVIGTPVEQEVRITSTQPSVAGTNLTLQYFPELNLLTPGSTLIALVKDEKNGNIVSNYKLFKNGEELKDENGNNKNFFVVELGKKYSLQATAMGYNTYVTSFSLTPQTVSVSFNPASPINLGSQLTFTQTPLNAKVTINGFEINGSYTPQTTGVYTIVASADGFLNYNGSFEVIQQIFLELFPDEKETKLNKLLSFKLNRETTINAFYKKDASSFIETLNETYAEDISITTTTIAFKPKKSGIYWVEADGINIWQHEFEGGFFKGISNWFGNRGAWFWVITVIIIIALVYFFVLKEKKGDGGMGYSTIESSSEGLKPMGGP